MWYAHGFVCCVDKMLVGLMATCAAVLCCCSDCRAEYPESNIRIVVPFAPGGESDTFVRILQGVVRQEKLLDQPLVVINVPGAGGTIGSRRVKDAAPDGYTILNLHDGILSAKLTGQADYGPEAFAPIAATGRSASMVCVNTDSDWTSLKQLLEAARDRPETIRFGANLGALSHFGALQLEQAVPGAAFRYVATGGGAERFGDIIGDHIDVSVFNVGEYVHFRDGGLRALAILHTERHADFPEVPTAQEQGIDVVRNSMQYWWAPKNTPPDRIAIFTRLLRRAMQTQAMQRKLADIKMDPVLITGPELRQTLRQRELVMKSVQLKDTIALPDTPLFAAVATALLGLVVFLQRQPWKGKLEMAQQSAKAVAGSVQPIVVTLPSQDFNIRRSVITLLMLILFCLLFSSGWVPFWLLSTGFVTLLGTMLLARNRRLMTVLVMTAAIVGPGCHYLFTRILTIDLP